MATETDRTPVDGLTDTATDVSDVSDAPEADVDSDGRLERFSSVQVYVHGTIALSIFVLYLTGLPMTFNEHLGWLFSVFTYEHVVLVHVAFGVVLIAVGTYYLLYLALTALLAGRLLDSFPTLGDVRESLAYVTYLFGRGEKPAAKKYTWLQKAEIWVLAVELFLLSATGLLLWYRGVFASPEFRAALGANEALADVLLLMVRDVHVVVALTMLMGISFHLYMVNVKERFPFNKTMFSGTVSADRARHHWAEWADEELGETETPHESSEDRPVPSSRFLTVTGLSLLAFFALVLISTLFAAVLSPLPTREYLIALPADPVTHGVASIVFFVGLNAAVVLILAGAAAICYGMIQRLRGEL